jgi:hypothetical protein
VFGKLGDLYVQRGALLSVSPPLPLLPLSAPLGIVLHDVANLSFGNAYLTWAADCYRQGLREQRQALKLGPPQPIHYVELTRQAVSLALLARRFGSYEDMADATSAAVEVAQARANEPDGGRGYRLAAAGMARCASLVGNARTLPASEKATQARQHADRAVELLRKAVQSGFRNAADLERAPEFASIRSRPDFQKLFRELKEKKQ